MAAQYDPDHQMDVKSAPTDWYLPGRVILNFVCHYPFLPFCFQKGANSSGFYFIFCSLFWPKRITITNHWGVDHIKVKIKGAIFSVLYKGYINICLLIASLHIFFYLLLFYCTAVAKSIDNDFAKFVFVDNFFMFLCNTRKKMVSIFKGFY